MLVGIAFGANAASSQTALHAEPPNQPLTVLNRFVPVTVTTVPTGPEVGLTPVMVGAELVDGPCRGLYGER